MKIFITTIICLISISIAFSQPKYIEVSGSGVDDGVYVASDGDGGLVLPCPCYEKAGGTNYVIYEWNIDDTYTWLFQLSSDGTCYGTINPGGSPNLTTTTNMSICDITAATPAPGITISSDVAVPTLSQWSLIMLSMGLLILGIVGYHQRQVVLSSKE